MTPSILIRCDASEAIGLGHLMRSLALGDALRDEGARVEFAMHAPSSMATSAVASGGFTLHQLDGDTGGFDKDAGRNLSVLMSARGISTVLVDHYAADSEYFRELARLEKLVGVIDDQAVRRFDGVSWLLNPNASIATSEYVLSPGAELLIGPEYALLRPEFAKMRTEQSEHSHAMIGDTKILVQFGGGRTDALCAGLVHWLQGVSHRCEIRCVLVGGDESTDRGMRAGRHAVTVFRSASNMPEHMRWADFSIGAGGSTCWELCCLGVPMIVGELSPDQERIVELLDERGAGINLGRWHDIDADRLVAAVGQIIADPQRRQRMSMAGMQLVDGQGARRASRSLIAYMTRTGEVVG